MNQVVEKIGNKCKQCDTNILQDRLKHICETIKHTGLMSGLREKNVKESLVAKLPFMKSIDTISPNET